MRIINKIMAIVLLVSVVSINTAKAQLKDGPYGSGFTIKIDSSKTFRMYASARMDYTIPVAYSGSQSNTVGGVTYNASAISNTTPLINTFSVPFLLLLPEFTLGTSDYVYALFGWTNPLTATTSGGAALGSPVPLLFDFTYKHTFVSSEIGSLSGGLGYNYWNGFSRYSTASAGFTPAGLTTPGIIMLDVMGNARNLSIFLVGNVEKLNYRFAIGQVFSATQPDLLPKIFTGYIYYQFFGKESAAVHPYAQGGGPSLGAATKLNLGFGFLVANDVAFANGSTSYSATTGANAAGDVNTNAVGTSSVGVRGTAVGISVDLFADIQLGEKGMYGSLFGYLQWAMVNDYTAYAGTVAGTGMATNAAITGSGATSSWALQTNEYRHLMAIQLGYVTPASSFGQFQIYGQIDRLDLTGLGSTIAKNNIVSALNPGGLIVAATAYSFNYEIGLKYYASVYGHRFKITGEWQSNAAGLFPTATGSVLPVVTGTTVTTISGATVNSSSSTSSIGGRLVFSFGWYM